MLIAKVLSLSAHILNRVRIPYPILPASVPDGGATKIIKRVIRCVPGGSKLILRFWFNGISGRPSVNIRALRQERDDVRLVGMVFCKQVKAVVERCQMHADSGRELTTLEVLCLLEAHLAQSAPDALGKCIESAKRSIAEPSAHERAHVLWAQSLFAAGRFGDALAALNRVPEPQTLNYLLLRADVCDAIGDMESAKSAYDVAAARCPLHPEIVIHRAFHLLKRGEILAGLREWAVAEAILGKYPVWTRKRLWTGGPLDGQSLFIEFEHNFGDQIQFSRFLNVIHARHPSASIHYTVAPPLRGLFRASFPWATSVDRPNCSDARFYCTSTQLPAILCAPNLDPTGTYLLASDRQQPARGEDSTTCRATLRVALCWRGRPLDFDKRRSLPISQVVSLLCQTSRLDIQWISLQNNVTIAESSALQAACPTIEFPEFADFLDLAQIMRRADIVVSVDTAAIHLAGAIGVSSVLLCRADRDWRWGATGNASPWYCNVHVIPHPANMDWDHVVTQCSAYLAEYSESRKTSQRLAQEAV
jgi:hypothetical protein